MNNVEDSEGSIDSRIKLVRSETIGQLSWDTSPSNINSGSGVNEWSQADIMKLMNPGYESESIGGSLYWNSRSGKCYNGQNNVSTDCDFTSSGINEEAKAMIEKVIWNIGSNGNFDWQKILTSKFYELERSVNTGKICTNGTYCNDSVIRKAVWDGYVGLIHLSDYGYATSGGTTTNRGTCLSTILYSWQGVCFNNNWFYTDGRRQWTMNPITYVTTNGAGSADRVGSLYSGVAFDAGFMNGIVKPVIYLNLKVKFVSGEGTSENPYLISF